MFEAVFNEEDSINIQNTKNEQKRIKHYSMLNFIEDKNHKLLQFGKNFDRNTMYEAAESGESSDEDVDFPFPSVDKVNY